MRNFLFLHIVVFLGLILFIVIPLIPHAYAEDPFPSGNFDAGNIFSHYFYITDATSHQPVIDRYLVLNGGIVSTKLMTYKLAESHTNSSGGLDLIAYKSDELGEGYRLIIATTENLVLGYKVKCICYPGTGDNPYVTISGTKFFQSDPKLNQSNAYVHDTSSYLQFMGDQAGDGILRVGLHNSEQPDTSTNSAEDALPDPWFFAPYDDLHLYRFSNPDPYTYVGRADLQNESIYIKNLLSPPTVAPNPAYCNSTRCVAFNTNSGGNIVFRPMNLNYYYRGGLWYLRSGDTPYILRDEWFTRNSNDERGRLYNEHQMGLIDNNDESRVTRVKIAGTIKTSLDWEHASGGRLRIIAFVGDPSQAGSAPLEGQDNTVTIKWEGDGTPADIKLAARGGPKVTFMACLRTGGIDYQNQSSALAPDPSGTIDFGSITIDNTNKVGDKCNPDIFEGTLTSGGSNAIDPSKVLGTNLQKIILDALGGVARLIQNFIIYVVQWMISVATSYVPI